MKANLKRLWSVMAVFSLILLVSLWVGNESQNLLYAILTLNVVMLFLSVPCSLFAVPVIFSAWYFLEMNPFSMQGVYLNTILLCLLGFVQWFWITKIWTPTEPVLQNLDLSGAN